MPIWTCPLWLFTEKGSCSSVSDCFHLLNLSWTSHHSSTNKSTPFFWMAAAFPLNLSYFVTSWLLYDLVVVFHVFCCCEQNHNARISISQRVQWSLRKISLSGKRDVPRVLGNNLWGWGMVLLEPLELPRGFILWVCDSNFFGEVITPPPVPAKLAWLLPGWPSKRGCPGWVPALESQLAEGLLDWLASSPELLAQAGVALLSWGSWLHGAALRFTNKQEARPLPPCWGWSPVLITQLAQGEGAAQDSQGS